MSQTSPLIALAGTIYPENGIVYGLRNGYMQSVLAAGGTPFLLPIGASQDAILELLSTADGILLTGGADVDPACYGEKRQPPVRQDLARARCARPFDGRARTDYT